MNQPIMQNPKPKVAKWLWITLIVVIVAAGAFTAWYFLMGPGKKTAATTTPATTTSVKPSIYKNTDYDFQLTFSDDWKGYKVTKEEQTFNMREASYAIWVPVPTKDYKKESTKMAGFFSPLFIEVITKQIWEASGTEQAVPGFIKIDENDKYVFGYEIREKELTGTTAAKFKNTLIPALVKTFKFTSATSSATDDATLKKAICEQLFPGYTYSAESINENYCNVDLLSGNFAEGIYGYSGAGAHWIATKVSDKWTEIQTSQDVWDCSLLEKYNFPKGFLTGNMAECYNPTTKATETW